MEGLELVMEGPSSLFPSLHSVGWLDGRPPLVRLCFFHRCSPPTIVPQTLCQARKVSPSSLFACLLQLIFRDDKTVEI